MLFKKEHYMCTFIKRSTGLMIFGLLLLGLFNSVSAQPFYSRLAEYTSTIPSEFNKIPGERKELLEELGEYILEKSTQKSGSQLLFICTLNSRRSQFAQVWAQAAAYHYKLKKVSTFSGGESETAINFRILEALRKAGFEITASEVYSQNPVYLLSMGRRYPDVFIFSKKYDYWNNPDMNYASIICSNDLYEVNFQPSGADETIYLPYEDIQIFDSSSNSYLRNDEICRQIAREMFYLMDYVKNSKNNQKKKKKTKKKSNKNTS